MSGSRKSMSRTSAVDTTAGAVMLISRALTAPAMADAQSSGV